MKKFTSFIALALALCLLLCSCSATKTDDGKKDETSGDKVTQELTQAPESESDTEKEEKPEENPPESTEPAAPVMTEEYKEILTALAGAFPWTYDEIFLVPNHEEMSYIYVQYPEMDGIGYALHDIDGNGTAELIIAAMDTGFIADVYTMKDGKAEYLFSGHQRSTYDIAGNGMIMNFWTGSNLTAGYDYYQLTDGEMVLEKRVTIDAYYAVDNGHVADHSQITSENCWFISDTMDYEDYVYVTEGLADSTKEEYDEKMGEMLTLSLTPLSEITK